MEYQKHTWIRYSPRTSDYVTQMKTVTYYVVTVAEEYTGRSLLTDISLNDGIVPFDGMSLIVTQNAHNAIWQTLIWDTQNIWLPGTGMMFSSS